MAYTLAQAHAPVGAVATLRVVDALMHVKDAVVSWNQTRVTRKILSRLSEHQLNDIGLTRSDLV